MYDFALNPDRPPKEWFYYMVERIRKQSSAYEPEAVAGEIWWHSMAPSTKRRIMKIVKTQRAKGKIAPVTSKGPLTKRQVQKSVGKRAATRLYKKMKLSQAEIREARKRVRKARQKPARRPAARRAAPTRRRAARANPELMLMMNPAHKRRTRRRNAGSAATGRFYPEEEGIRIENLPEPNVGEQTGYVFEDYHGTWYEVRRDSDGSTFWMIGEPMYSSNRRAGSAGATRRTRSNASSAATGRRAPSLASIKKKRGYKAAVKKHFQLHGCEPAEIVVVDVPYECPEFLIALGQTPDAIYTVPKYSKKRGKGKNRPYKHDYENPVMKVTDATGKMIADLPLTNKTRVTDWIHG